MTDCASPSRVIAISPRPDDVALSITDTLTEIGQARSDLRFSLVTSLGFRPTRDFRNVAALAL